MGRRSGLTVEQRSEAVLALLRREEPAVAIARRLGISEPTLYRYREQFLDGGQRALAGSGSGGGKGDGRDRQIESLRQAVAHRDRVIGEMTIANRLLKKTAECPR